MSAPGEQRVHPTVAEAQSACADYLVAALRTALNRATAATSTSAPGSASASESGTRGASVPADSVALSSRVSFGVSGGSAVRAVYERMAASDLDWSRVDVVFADERCVPPDDKDSNYKLVMESLGSRVSAKVLRMEGERPNHEAAAASYAKALPAKVDVLLLGMGPDGHTASLFPGHASLKSTARVLFESDSPKPPPARLSLGPSAIRDAGVVVMLATGKEKAAMIARARSEGPIDEVPARLARHGVWFLDEAAATP